jgi:predicted acylesterase/phospholipase RssA
MPQTTFFHSCLGVFQGGGCRAAALVGAYNEAIRRGVQFTEVAGTSAGSIIAVLIGAGASPEQLTEFVKELNFNTLLVPPEIEKQPGRIRRLLTAPFGRIANIFLHQGLYSSRAIESWVERCLRKLLGDQQGPITFSQLLLPTSVVATDIVSQQARRWNQRISPDESVAYAVRASCSIPIFFQPVRRQFVDGGLLSNLPSFVFENSASDRPLTSRVLAFVLQGDPDQITEWGTLPFFTAIANTVVDGAQQIQLQLQKNVHAVVIPTGKIKATDFEKIKPEVISTLIESGRKASSDFFESELAQVKAPHHHSDVRYDREDLYNSFTTHLDEEVTDVLISEFDTEFVYHIFPSLLLWKMRNARVRVILAQSEAKPQHGAYRRRLLRSLGIEVIEVSTPPFRAYIVNGHMPDRGTAYVATPTEQLEAVAYHGALHAHAVEALYAQLSSVSGNSSRNVFQPGIIKDTQDPILQQLKTVTQYQRNGVNLSLESIPLSSLVALTNYVHEYKYRQVKHWIPEFAKRDIPLFQSASVTLHNNAKSMITPPVVEDAGGKYVLVEGSTRATYLRDHGETRIVCVVARGIQDPLPGKTLPFANVRVVGRRLDTDLRYDDFNYAYFRKIELAAHPLNSLLPE